MTHYISLVIMSSMEDLSEFGMGSFVSLSFFLATENQMVRAHRVFSRNSGGRVTSLSRDGVNLSVSLRRDMILILI